MKGQPLIRRIFERDPATTGLRRSFSTKVANSDRLAQLSTCSGNARGLQWRLRRPQREELVIAKGLDRAIGAFRAEFGGTLILPHDPDYDRARSVWNGAIDRRPTVIARCSTARQVAEAVRLGRVHGLEIAVRGGGHSFAGLCLARTCLPQLAELLTLTN